MAANLELGSGVAMTTPKPIDFYGKFDAIDEPTAVALALASIPLALRYVGRKVLCNGVEYVFSSLTDNGLVPSMYLSSPNSRASLVTGAERYNMDIESISVTSNILRIKFVKENTGYTQLVIKSNILGITTPTAFNIIIPTFPAIRDLSVYELDLEAPIAGGSYAQADIPNTTTNDIELIDVGVYLNESIASFSKTSVFVGAPTNAWVNTLTLTLNSDGIFTTFACNLECTLLGLTPLTNTSYTFTRFSSLVYTAVYNTSTSNTDLTTTPYDGSNFVIYIQTNLEDGNYAVINSLAELKRSISTGSEVKGVVLDNKLDWTNGSRNCNVVDIKFGWKTDTTGEFLPIPQNSSTWNNIFSQPLFTTNRPRTNNATTFNHFYAQGVFGGVCGSQVGFNSNEYYIPQCNSVSVHGLVSSTGVNATVNTSSNHGFTVGNTVIINSPILGLVNDSVVILTVTVTSYTFAHTTVVSSTLDSNGYSYLTQNRRATTTISGNGTLMTVNSTAHGYPVNATVFIHSPVLLALGLPLGTPVTVQTSSTNSFTFLSSIVLSSTSDSSGYSNRSIIPHILTTDRTSNVLTIKFTSAPNQTDTNLYSVAIGFQLNSYFRITNASLGLTSISFNVQNLTSDTPNPVLGTTPPPNIIKVINTGADVAPIVNNLATVTFSNKFHSRSLGKAKSQNLQGWFVAGTEPTNTVNDSIFPYTYDRLRVGYYADMTQSVGYGSTTWNHFTKPNVMNRNFFGRHSYFGNTITEVTANDINVISDGAMVFGNTTTGTPIDGTLSKLPNGDANYFSNGNWRGILYVLGGSGANTNIVTNTANALMKFVGTGLQAISSLLLDNGNTLSYTGIGGISTLRNTRYSTVTETPIITSATATNLLTTVPGVTYKAPISGVVSGGNVFTITDILNTDVTKRLKIEFNASAITGFTAGSTITICFGTAGTSVLGTFTIPTLNAGIGEVLTSLSINAELIVKTRGGSGTFSLDGIASLRSAGATGGENAYTYSNRDIHLTQSVGTFNTAQTNLLMLRATTPAAGTVTVSKFNLIVMS